MSFGPILPLHTLPLSGVPVSLPPSLPRKTRLDTSPFRSLSDLPKKECNYPRGSHFSLLHIFIISLITVWHNWLFIWIYF